MNVDKAVLMFAGFVVMLGLALGYTVSPYWYLLTAFAGVKHVPGVDHRVLPRGDHLQEARLRGGCAFS